MKKISLILILLSLWHNLYSDETGFEYNGVDISLKFLIPNVKSTKPMAFFNIGTGFNYTIIPNILSPGLYVDLGLGINFAFVFLTDDYEKEAEKKEEFIRTSKEDGTGASFAARINNAFKIGYVGIIPFIGLNITYNKINYRVPKTFINPNIGLSLIIDNLFGLEYSYYIPTTKSNNIVFHNISIIYRALGNRNQ